MPFNPFTSVTGRNALTLFDIRLDNDFLVFRGNDHEASGQLLKGVLAICVPSSIKVEDIHLRLTGVRRLLWNDPKVTPSGLTSQKVDRTNVILHHQWAPFWGTPGKSAVLEKGNYEFPFELMLPGATAESVEGLHEASITYKLKATIARGKLAYDLHAYKHLRVVRTLESSALEFLHAMSVENIWPNKIEYSIVVPQKAIVFGSVIPLETRFTPLLKGLELGDISVRLIEIHDFVYMPNGHSSTTSLSSSAAAMREYKHERVVASWTLHVNREEHWQDVIEDTGQEGWVLNTLLDLPRKLGKCIQDVNVHGIKVRHKLKMVVALKNPDGHISELRATLPLTIFISPNIPLDDQGNLTCPAHMSTSPTEMSNIAPPGYGEHVLDQLYDEVEINNLQTPAPMSAVHSPLYGNSRAGSTENLAAMASAASMPVPPAALTSRLQDVSSRQTHWRSRSSTVITPPGSLSGVSTPYSPLQPLQPLHQVLQQPPSISQSLSQSMPHSPLHSVMPSGVHNVSNVSNNMSSNVPSSVPSNAPSNAPSGQTSRAASQPHSEATSRRNSGESHHAEHSEHPEHLDFPDMNELCKVPSYATAMKNTRVATITVGDRSQLPDYRTAAATASTNSLTRTPSSSTSGSSSTPPTSTSGTTTTLSSEPLSLIAENGSSSTGSRPNTRHGTMPMPMPSFETQMRRPVQPRSTSYQGDLAGNSGHHRRAQTSGGVPLMHLRHGAQNGETDDRSWLQILQSRGRVVTSG